MADTKIGHRRIVIGLALAVVVLIAVAVWWFGFYLNPDNCAAIWCDNPEQYGGSSSP